jgi:hypothetical protein
MLKEYNDKELNSCMHVMKNSFDREWKEQREIDQMEIVVGMIKIEDPTQEQTLRLLLTIPYKGICSSQALFFYACKVLHNAKFLYNRTIKTKDKWERQVHSLCYLSRSLKKSGLFKY